MIHTPSGSGRAPSARRAAGIALGLAAVIGPLPGQAAELLVPEQYPTIQAALHAAGNGDVVSVAPGVYHENVKVLKDGVTLLSRVPHAATIDGGGADHTVICSNVTCTVEGFVITNAHVFKAGVFTSQKSQVIRHNRIVGNHGDGMMLSSGSVVLAEGNTITDNGSLYRGVRFLTGATGFLLDNYIARNGTGIQAYGVPGLVIEHNTIVDHSSVSISVGGTAVIRHNIVANSPYGIYYSGPYDADLQGVVAAHLTIAYNDLWNHSQADYYAFLGGVPDATSGTFVPVPGTGEIGADPLLQDVQLLPGSPCIDAGIDPAAFSGVPCRDIDGKPRLIDGDLDGTARPDIGAFEFETPPAGPPEVQQLRWDSGGPPVLTWDPVEGASLYSVYRGDVAAVGYDDWGSCLTTTAAASFTEFDAPDPGTGFFYLVTASDALLVEGSSGDATCAVRSIADPCVTP